MRQNKQPVLWVLWHPHQGLWNWTLLGLVQRVIPIASIHKTLNVWIIHLDTLILLLRAIAIRVSLFGPLKVITKARVPDWVSILYLDLGTHKNGAELSMVVDEILPFVCKNFMAYGFEASHRSFQEVAEKFSDRQNVHLINTALIHAIPESGKITLFEDMGSGIGDSIYRHSDRGKEVEAMRLSDFLTERHLVRDGQIILLRMNIEGAEFDVLRDLVETGLSSRIDGYFGMWDDVNNIDLTRGTDFRSFLSKHQIRTFTFNARDLKWRLRRKWIRYHVHTRIMHGLRRLQWTSTGG